MYLESRKSLSSKAFRTRSLLCKPRVCHTVQSNGNGIRDLIGNNYGQVHIPLRKDWKKRLVNRKKQLCNFDSGFESSNLMKLGNKVEPVLQTKATVNTGGWYRT
ncbi:hypothetical protein PC117_g25948 [Phytophthora cactorum]|uniref:Uncharacterized protein n=1 Tax=Phytophthora cactorum TaxID=29920 RepID=A0A8T1ANN4_9STRA|nr:hypothetical protein PC117_g25948 [Phytophthora cactorum]